MANPYSKFLITDGTTDTDTGHRHEVSLLGLENGICITGWTMGVSGAKNDGVWADPATTDGRQLKTFARANVQETLTLTIVDWDADALADDLHLLYDLLEKAMNWGPSGWSKEPVWIEAIGVNETNTRYSLIHKYGTPGAGNPFQQPFWQTVLRSTITDFDLILEREPAWRGNAPGDADCVEISAAQGMCMDYPLVFDGDTSFVNLLSPASLDNLAVGASFTVETWINAAGWGENNIGTIVSKDGSATGWIFYHTPAAGLSMLVVFDVTLSISTSGSDEWDANKFGGWYHVAGVFNNADKKCYLWINGTAIASYAQQQIGANNALADAASNAYIGNALTLTSGWNGQIGWVKISSAAIYTPGVDFDAPYRCPLPWPIATTEFLGIREGTGATVFDQSSNGNDGTANNTTWGNCCGAFYGTYDPVNDELEEECLDEFAYIANKHNTIGLTHIFVDDGGVFGLNLLTGNPPYSLLPAGPVADDRVYFGIDSTRVDAGPFCSLMFDLSQAQADIADLDWEYWNGGWVPLSGVQDNTDADGLMSGAAFDTVGRKSVHWPQPDDWATVVVNGVTALWVRAEVQDAGTQPPIQQNRHVYTCLWPFFEVQKDQLAGNIPALARLYLRNQSHGTNPDLLRYYSRVLIGLRSVSRGAYFSPYLNFGNRTSQNFQSLTPDSSLTFTAIGTGSVVADTTTATGHAFDITNPAAAATAGYFTVTKEITEQYQGIFHLLARGKQKTGAVGDLDIRLSISTSTVPGLGVIEDSFFSSEWVPFVSLEDRQILDFGLVTIDTIYGGFPATNLTIFIEAQGDGAADARLYDMLLFPVDEWAADIIDVKNTFSSIVGYRGVGASTPGAGGGYGQILNVDSVSGPRRWRSTVHAAGDDSVFYIWQGRAPNGPVLLPSTRQRVWFFSTRIGTIGIGSTVEEVSYPETSGSIRAWASEMYLLMRGDK